MWLACVLGSAQQGRPASQGTPWAGLEGRRGLSPSPHFYWIGAYSQCSTLLSALLCALGNHLPLVMGGTLYFEESWAGPGCFIAGLQLLRGGEGRCSSSTVIPHARAWSSCAETFLKQLSVSLCRAGGRLGLKAAAGSVFLQAQPCPCFAMCCVLNICSLLGL